MCILTADIRFSSVFRQEFTDFIDGGVHPAFHIAGDIDRMEALGIYEVAPEDFALCEFVCSSKMELQRIVRAGLDMLRSEMA